MIGFITAYHPLDSEKYRAQYDLRVKPGLARQIIQNEEHITVYISDADRGLAHAYNRALDWAKMTKGLHAMVFLHADLELLDPLFTVKLMDAFERKYDPEAAIVGLIGAAGFSGIDWWNAPKKVGRMHHGTECDIQPGVYFEEREGFVDAVDGCIVAFSPWAMENLRFDEELCPAFHGWELDVCTLARSMGKKVLVIDSEARHHTKGGYGDKAEWDRCNAAYRKKWGRWLMGRRA